MNLDPANLFFGRPGSDPSSDPSSDSPEPPGFPGETPWQSMRREYRSQGYSIYAHPLGVLRSHLASLRPALATAADLETKPHRARVRIAGLLAMVQKPPTAKGMCFLSLEDETGLFNAVLTPDVYERCRATIMNASLLDISGVLESRAGVRNVRVETMQVVFAERLIDTSRINESSTR